jgi:hypothetical protein
MQAPTWVKCITRPSCMSILVCVCVCVGGRAVGDAPAFPCAPPLPGLMKGRTTTTKNHDKCPGAFSSLGYVLVCPDAYATSASFAHLGRALMLHKRAGKRPTVSRGTPVLLHSSESGENSGPKAWSAAYSCTVV